MRTTMATRLPDEDATRAYARSLAARLPNGALLLVDGPLGAGKTTLVRALVEALGGPRGATSPSYALVHEYPAPGGPIVHVDAYRLSDVHDVVGLGLDDYLERARLVVIEWGGGLADAYPEAWRLTMARPAGTTSLRTAELIAPGG